MGIRVVRLKVVSIDQSQSWSDRELRTTMSWGGKRRVEGAFKNWWALPTLEISGGEGRQIIEVVWMINDKK